MEIIGFSNYLIYKDGKVLSKKSNKYLIPVLKNNGYYGYCLRNNPIQKNYLVHRLIAIHYIPNPNNYKYVDHINRNRTDNRIINLRWATALMNQQNTSKQKNNKSGHKNILYRKDRNSWEYKYRVMGRPIFRRTFKNKIDCLCYKFICLLRQNKFN